MKQLQNNFTTPEQSKRLLELGVPADSADLCFYKTTSMVYIDGSIPKYLIDKGATYSVLLDAKKRALREDTFTMLPCWSVGRLIEIAILCTQHYTGSDIVQFQRECLNYGLIECLIALLQVSKDDGDLDFSKLEE